MFENQNKRSVYLRILIVVVVVLIVIVSLYVFSNTVNNSIESNLSRQLNEVSLQQKTTIDNYIESRFTMLRITASLLSDEDDLMSADLRDRLNTPEILSGFTGVNICTSDGRFYSILTNEILSASQREYFIASMSGQEFISDVLTSQSGNELVIILSVPIYRDSQIIGVLCGICKTSSLGNLLDISSFDGLGYTGIVDSSLNIVTSADGCKEQLTSAFDNIENTKFYDGNTYDELKSAISGKEEFYSQFDINNEKSYVYFIPMNYNGWYLCSVIPVKAVETYTQPIMKTYIAIVILAGILLAGCKLSQQKVLNEYSQSVKKLRQEANYARNLLSNSITASKYDIDDDKFIDMPTSWIKQFGLNPEGGYDEVIGGLAEASVHPDDRGKFLAVSKEYLRECYEKGIPNIELRYRRILKNQGSMKWMKNTMYISKDPITGHIVSMAVVEDIDDENRKLEELKARAQTDPLTGLFNRKSLIENIENYLNHNFGHGNVAVLMMIDIDDFKNINDTLGHDCGDRAINNIADTIRREFRSGDLFGRLGGDEFVVFCKDVVSVVYAQKKAETFCESIKKIFVCDSIDFSCSIGYSIAPDDGLSFDELYKKADLAMYHAKQIGKGKCIKYEETMKNGK